MRKVHDFVFRRTPTPAPKVTRAASDMSSDKAIVVKVLRNASNGQAIPLRVLRRSQSFSRFLMSVKKRLGIEYDVEIFLTDLSTNRRIVSMVNLKVGQTLLVDEVALSVANANVTKLGFLLLKNALGIWEKFYFAVARSTLYGWREHQTLDVDTFGLKVDPNVKTPDFAFPLDGVCVVQNGKVGRPFKKLSQFDIWHPVRRRLRLRVPLDDDAESWMIAIGDASLCSPYPLPPDYYQRTVLARGLDDSISNNNSFAAADGMPFPETSTDAGGEDVKASPAPIESEVTEQEHVMVPRDGVVLPSQNGNSSSSSNHPSDTVSSGRQRNDEEVTSPSPSPSPSPRPSPSSAEATRTGYHAPRDHLILRVRASGDASQQQQQQSPEEEEEEEEDRESNYSDEQRMNVTGDPDDIAFVWE